MWFGKARRERELGAAEELRVARRLVDGDVTAFGQELGALREDTQTGTHDGRMQNDYRRALDHYDSAREELAAATTVEAVVDVEQMLRDGRFHLACVLAGRNGTEPPQRRDPCFFDPRHGPAAADVAWTPQGEVERMVGVCSRDQHRLAAGEEPEVRLIRVGDRWVPWHEAGGSVAYVARHQAHVVRPGAGTSLTDRHLAEAHTRTVINGGVNGAGAGPLG